MKKYLLLAVLAVPLAGCNGFKERHVNQLRGYHQDEANYHTEAADAYVPILYKVNDRVIPKKMYQIEETLTWQEKIKARIKASRED
jgi:hypothetical protein